MLLLEGGEFLMGGQDHLAYPGDGEGPVRRVRVDGFRIDDCAVSNEQFARFAAATGHVTEAEWEYAARGAIAGEPFPWGGELEPGGRRSSRGGSYLCRASYCRRYRVSARNALTPDSSAGDVGFRRVAEV
jgi:formylglycine-generating enzyme required for sulfatase activity